ncbi:hypothetical protein V495_03619 [Pseudogymnoascus sp. VKM F-4514 (FW-929)]|nr:hypothetical protein V495_03619 [Pseudogymnoascus sp. VKM F-4514 (FW-929)]KFY66447.1 hypothetical protein V497_00903 [Pseudogymnoascus sp. VKM F-4516 (FW-969)]
MKFSVATTILVLAAGVMGAAYPEPNDAGAEARLAAEAQSVALASVWWASACKGVKWLSVGALKRRRATGRGAVFEWGTWHGERFGAFNMNQIDWNCCGL